MKPPQPSPAPTPATQPLPIHTQSIPSAQALPSSLMILNHTPFPGWPFSPDSPPPAWCLAGHPRAAPPTRGNHASALLWGACAFCPAPAAYCVRRCNVLRGPAVGHPHIAGSRQPGCCFPFLTIGLRRPCSSFGCCRKGARQPPPPALLAFPRARLPTATLAQEAACPTRLQPVAEHGLRKQQPLRRSPQST